VSAATLVLVRHGETDWNRDGRVQGHTDVPLNDTGRQQARAVADLLAEQPLSAAYSSDLARALETATIVAGPLGLEVVALEGLREKHFGSWEGLTGDEVRARYPQAATGHWGDGETTEAMTARVLGALHEIAAAHPGEAVLVVTHGGPMRAVLRRCDVDHGPIVNCHVLRLHGRDGALRPVD
jgi:broad specificity phosphatase PhoE